MTHRLGFWIAHFNIVAVGAVLLGAFGVQFLEGEYPCPLCIMQRMGMLLCLLGPAYIIMRARHGDVPAADFATGYGMSVVAAVLGAAIAGRQILLHILPNDPGYGAPMFGLHLYSWSFVVFTVVLLVSGVNLMFAAQLTPQGVHYGWPSRLTLALLALLILSNAVAVFFEEGLHWTMPGEPTRYELLYDLGWQ